MLTRRELISGVTAAAIIPFLPSIKSKKKNRLILEGAIAIPSHIQVLIYHYHFDETMLYPGYERYSKINMQYNERHIIHIYNPNDLDGKIYWYINWAKTHYIIEYFNSLILGVIYITSNDTDKVGIDIFEENKNHIACHDNDISNLQKGLISVTSTTYSLS